MTNRRTFLKNSSLVFAASTFPITNFFVPRKKEKLGVALVGLGYYSRDLLAPALQLTDHCELRGIVTGTPEKIPVWQSKYGIEDHCVYDYQNMHMIANNDEIDVVYIVLPNALHKKYSILAADAGKHVWCEKPMALTESECTSMIKACRKNRVQLSIGYRMQHEPVTQEIIGWATSQPYGKISSIYAEAGFKFGNPDKNHWRLHKKLGGGAMYDMGVYPLNAVRYATQMEPIRVKARTEVIRPELFKVDETTYFDLEFPGGWQASCRTSFAESMNLLKIDCQNGGYELAPFQSYSGVKGKTTDGKILKPYQGNQQAKQMDDDALAIMQGRTPIVTGEEGRKDIRVVEAIFESASKGGTSIQL